MTCVGKRERGGEENGKGREREEERSCFESERKRKKGRRRRKKRERKNLVTQPIFTKITSLFSPIILYLLSLENGLNALGFSDNILYPS